MTRRALFLTSTTLLTSVGCQSYAQLPGIDPTDYAYTNFECNTTQVYPQSVPQVQTSALEAMADLGFTDLQCSQNDRIVIIHAKTVDHRPARISIRPRNAMSSMTVKIGLVGDEMVAQALIQRVSLNFGALPRTIIPLEPTLSRRIDPLSPRPLMAPSDTFPPVRMDPPILPFETETPSPFSPEVAPTERPAVGIRPRSPRQA